MSAAIPCKMKDSNCEKSMTAGWKRRAIADNHQTYRMEASNVIPVCVCSMHAMRHVGSSLNFTQVDRCPITCLIKSDSHKKEVRKKRKIKKKALA
jgi:hypothetical protein